MIKKVSIMALSLCVALIVGLIFLKKELSRSQPSNEKDSKKLQSRRMVELAIPASIARRSGMADPSTREKDLAALKRRWDELGSRVDTWTLIGDNRAEVDALVNETIDRLSCGPELSNLLRHLQKESYGNPIISQLDKAVAHLLKSDRSAEARQEVLRLSARDEHDILGTKAEWSVYAGAGCDKNSLEMFLKDLESSESAKGRGVSLRQDALLGYAVELAKTDPREAVSLAIHQLTSGLISRSGAALSKQLAMEFPPQTNFEEIQEEILRTMKVSSAVDNGKNELQASFIKKWAQVSPADAANYFMAHAEAYSPSLIANVTEVVGEANPLGGSKWAQAFPAGEYRDAALFGALKTLANFPDEAKLVADQIQDPSLKKQSEEILALFDGL